MRVNGRTGDFLGQQNTARKSHQAKERHAPGILSYDDFFRPELQRKSHEDYRMFHLPIFERALSTPRNHQVSDKKIGQKRGS